MNNSDVTCIVNAEGEQSSPEKYLCRLKDQENFKCIALVVLYNKEVAGYVCIYHYSTNGILGEEGFSEIADFGILGKYKDLGIEKKLLDITEQIASEYSNIV